MRKILIAIIAVSLITIVTSTANAQRRGFYGGTRYYSRNVGFQGYSVMPINRYQLVPQRGYDYYYYNQFRQPNYYVYPQTFYYRGWRY